MAQREWSVTGDAEASLRPPIARSRSPAGSREDLRYPARVMDPAHKPPTLRPVRRRARGARRAVRGSRTGRRQLVDLTPLQHRWHASPRYCPHDAMIERLPAKTTRMATWQPVSPAAHTRAFEWFHRYAMWDACRPWPPPMSPASRREPDVASSSAIWWRPSIQLSTGPIHPQRKSTHAEFGPDRAQRPIADRL
jgi:hypothetical protein